MAENALTRIERRMTAAVTKKILAEGGDGVFSPTGLGIAAAVILIAPIWLWGREEKLHGEGSRVNRRIVLYVGVAMGLALSFLPMPEGATPKDGPSAGIAMATAIVSLLTGIPVRRDIAMTGEVTLRGRVLPIGGLKEKLLAALRGGLKKVLIPQDNAKDLADIPANVKNALEIVPVSRMDEVLKHALVRLPIPIVWEEEAPVKGATPAIPDEDQSGVVAH
jgi:hypothetical protein